MSNLLAIGTYNLELIPGIPTPVLDEDFPVTVHIKMAALDPAGVEGDDNEEPSTVRILKRTVNVNDYDDENSEDDMDLSDEEVEEAKPVSKKGKKAAAAEESDEEEEEDDEEDDEEDFEVEEYVLCTLSPKTGYQQTLDLVISSDEEIVFEVRGSYPVHLTGNYVEHPFDNQNSDEEEEFDSELEEDSEDELDSDIEEEIVQPKKEVKKVIAKKEEPKKAPAAVKKEETKKAPAAVKEVKETKKRAAEIVEPKVDAKKTKKEDDKKSVTFNKELEQGPTKKAAKPVVRKIEGGVSVEDRTVGQGPVAKKGSKVGVRYVGKLKNGKIFDSNTKGKPFAFNLGKGEVIKGWDVGVAGMAVNGERRIVIPASYAYGKQALPGIPANSELTFDVKLVNIR
ncbi:hypothetical protein NADFUDRAFT_82790 [Nadsonia fulvescens var. elongata DSM 6958]|uniref:FK506-binding protein n=1 Tax=Nadsonia fulvescens var. elongata DSM 6958 TaxID=857566 RepID=A0A1E3PKV9_9ASCO|nr:hypothetical protein NADFUDRAFT_82790 [Nadsonia fulvescens var. elongata DSM 6958]